MTIDQTLRRRLHVSFTRLNAAAATLPPPGSLSSELDRLIPSKKRSLTSINVPPKIASLWSTAAVEVWMRGVHSFLVSAALTSTSPIWASVSGYYSSHYCIRGFAHLLGYFQLFRRKMIVRLELSGDGRYVCSFNRKQKFDQEHKFYWQIVKKDVQFSADPLFTVNLLDDDISDVAHRNKANYFDHVNRFPNFSPPNKEALRRRIQVISQFTYLSPPIPQRDRFPDVDSVQIVAYRRIARFRHLLDEVLGNKNRFWNIFRNPAWARDIIDFQQTDADGLQSLAN